MSACILPVAPEFQDPPAAQNYSPIFVDADPPIGSSVIPSRFTVVVRDPNNDDLFVRWLADYPPYSQDTRPLNVLTTRIPHPVDLQPIDLPPVDVDCVLNNLSPQLAFHRIQVIISDGEFIPASEQPTNQPIDLGLVADGRFAIRANWIWSVKCNQ